MLDLHRRPWLQHGDLELLGPKVLDPVEARPYYEPLASLISINPVSPIISIMGIIISLHLSYPLVLWP